MFVFEVTYWIVVALAVIAFVIELRGLVDGAVRPASAFVAAEKRSKAFWVGLMAAGVVFGYLSIPSVWVGGFRFGFGLPWLFALVAVLPAAIYLADVRGEVVRYTPRRR